MRDIPARENIRRAGLVGLAIHLDQPALRFNAIARTQERKVGGLADGKDDAIRRDIFDHGIVERRIETPGRVKHRGTLHGAQRELAFFGDNRLGSAPVVQPDPFFAALDDFHLVGGHLLAAFEADHVDFLVAADAQRGACHIVSHLFAAFHLGYGFAMVGGIAGAHGGARHIVSHVAAADHHDAASQRQGLPGVEGAQKIHTVQNIGAVRARHRQFAALGQAYPDEDGFIADVPQIGQGEVAAQPNIALQLDAQGQDRVDFAPHQFARQAENGHAHREHAAGFGVGFEYGHFVAGLRQVVRHGEPRDPRSHDCYALVIAWIRREHGVVTGLAMQLEVASLGAERFRDETLQRADGDRLIERAAPAVGFAGRAAHPPANGREGPLADGRYAIEQYEIDYVISGRDLATPPAKVSGVTKAVVMADPDYDLSPAATASALQAVFRTAQPPAAAQLAMRGVFSDRGGISHVDRLPGTAQEARAITPQLASYAKGEPGLYLGRYALEGVFKALSKPRVLVLSTHGFFLSDQQVEPAQPARTSAADGSRSAALTTGTKPLENPLLRCGLLLAGCNQRTRPSTPAATPTES